MKPVNSGLTSVKGAGALMGQSGYNTGFVDSLTESTFYPPSAVEPPKLVLTLDKRAELELAIQQIVDAALADRQNLDSLLDYWNRLYEQDVGIKTTPWPNSANVFIPLVPTYVDSIVSQLQALVYTPRFFVVTGLTPSATQVAYTIEQYYNHLMYKYNWASAFYTVLQLAARDGVGMMEVVWDRTTRKTKKVLEIPRVVNTPMGPVPLTDEGGEVAYDSITDEFEETVYDDVRLVPVELRDFFLSPAWSTSIEQAVGVARAAYITEHEIRKLVEGGVLWEDAADRVISFTNTQTTDLSLDRQPIGTYKEAGAISIGAERGGAVSGEVKILRGPIKLWRYHSKEFQINKNGEPEELVLWYHDASRTLVGVNRYPYLHGKRPFVACVLMPRPNRFRGFGVPERLSFLQTEANSLENQALDRVDQALQAPMYQVEDVKLIKGDKEWGPGAMFRVPQGPTDIGYLTLPPLPVDVYQLRQDIELQAQKLLGFTPTTFSSAQAARSGQNKYMAEVAMQNTQMRMESMSQQVRQFSKDVFQQINALKVQYGPPEETFSTSRLGKGQQFVVSKDMLSESLELDVSGDVTNLNRAGRTQDAMLLYQALMQEPLVASNPQHRFAVLRNLLESMGYGSLVVDLIGTEQEAVQTMQQMAQAQAAQQQELQADAQVKQAQAGAVRQKSQAVRPPTGG